VDGHDAGGRLHRGDEVGVDLQRAVRPAQFPAEGQPQAGRMRGALEGRGGVRRRQEGQRLRPEQMTGGEAQEQGARAGGLLVVEEEASGGTHGGGDSVASGRSSQRVLKQVSSRDKRRLSASS